jgi:hypothetical protein
VLANAIVPGILFLLVPLLCLVVVACPDAPGNPTHATLGLGRRGRSLLLLFLLLLLLVVVFVTGFGILFVNAFLNYISDINSCYMFGSSMKDMKTNRQS